VKFKHFAQRTVACLLVSLISCTAAGGPFIEPGREAIRHDLQLLADSGVVQTPVTTWPLIWTDVVEDIDEAEPQPIDVLTSMERLRDEGRAATETDRILRRIRIGLEDEPRVMRTFADSPRERGELEAGFSRTGDRLAYRLNVVRVEGTVDEWRPDGSYLSLRAGNWALVGGYPERWWGPGLEGSTILSTNARPLPQVGIQRIDSRPFSPRWLRWIGPWNLVSFFGAFDDDRTIDDARLFGLRLTARPLPRLEIGLSRTAQFCGEGRQCDLSTFGNVLLGRDNRGVNVSDADEPGNQLAGFDLRWALPDNPFAFYMQWTGEDSRQGGPWIGSWLRLAGGEHWSTLRGGWQQRTHFEVADTRCKEGGGGFGTRKFNCAYQHGLYATGYRYENRPLGHAIDSDSQSLAVSSFLLGPRAQNWTLSARYIKVNLGPLSMQPHAVSQTPARYSELEVAHGRELPIGRIALRLSLVRSEDVLTGFTDSDAHLSFQWQTGY
jgi:hypothetical protein